MCVTASAKPMKKSVRWSTVTVYEFDVAIGGSSVPRHGGPSVGLAKTPTCVWSTPLDAHTDEEDEVEECAIHLEEESTTHRPDADDQPQLQSRAATKICERQQRRRCRVRWLKPFERVTMLTQAGLSERRIYRMMKECAAICMSRRLSIQSR
jgi:hypothetical protein